MENFKWLLKYATKVNLGTLNVILLLFILAMIASPLHFDGFNWDVLYNGMRPIVAIATVSGIIIALLQFRMANKNREEDLANRRFDYTSTALNLFYSEIKPNIEMLDFKVFDDKISAYQYDEAGYLTENQMGRRFSEISEFLNDATNDDFVNQFTSILFMTSRLSGYLYYPELFTRNSKIPIKHMIQVLDGNFT
ncbi:hypothetical protein, partial [Secundilactobacillus muriivasis]